MFKPTDVKENATVAAAAATAEDCKTNIKMI